MRTGNEILRKLSDVSHLFLGNVIFPKTFLQQQVSGVLFIAERSPYVLCRPCTATHRAYLLFIQFLGNCQLAHTRQII